MIFEVGAAAAAGLIVYAVTLTDEDASGRAQWPLVIICAVAAFAATWWAGRKRKDAASSAASRNGEGGRGINVGSGIHAGGHVAVEDVSVGTDTPAVNVGTNLQSKKNATVKGVRVGKPARRRKK